MVVAGDEELSPRLRMSIPLQIYVLQRDPFQEFLHTGKRPEQTQTYSPPAKLADLPLFKSPILLRPSQGTVLAQHGSSPSIPRESSSSARRPCFQPPGSVAGESEVPSLSSDNTSVVELGVIAPTSSARRLIVLPPRASPNPLAEGLQPENAQVLRHTVYDPPVSKGFGEEGSLVNHSSTALDSLSEAVNDDMECAVFTSVRQVLSTDPLYAEQIISAVKQLPAEKLSLLLGGEPGPETSGLPEGEAALVDLADTPSRSTSSSRGGSVKKSDSTTSSFASSSRKLRRKRATSLDGDEQNGEEDGSGGPNEKQPPDKKKYKKGDKNWACPYYLAHPRIIAKARFGACRPPGYFIERSDWKGHLKRVHSPEAKHDPDDDNAPYYMDKGQWAAVQSAIDEADKSRPRDPEAWYQAQLMCYLAVWRIIFPAHSFPGLKEPTTPFHPDHIDKTDDIRQQALVLFDAIYAVRAGRAIQAGIITSQENFQPSKAEYREMLAESFAIVASMSPDASVRILAPEPETLRDAVMERPSETGPSPAPAAMIGDSNVRAGASPSALASQYLGGSGPAEASAPQSDAMQPAMARIPLPETVLHYSAAQINAMFPNAQLVLQIPVPEVPSPRVIPPQPTTPLLSMVDFELNKNRASSELSTFPSDDDMLSQRTLEQLEWNFGLGNG